MKIDVPAIHEAANKNAVTCLDEFAMKHGAELETPVIAMFKTLRPMMELMMQDAFEEGVMWILKEQNKP